MKLLVLTAVKSYEKEAIRLFKHAKINTFSSTDINGFKSNDNENLIDNWFSASNLKIESILFFSFTDQYSIDTLLQGLHQLNRTLKEESPIRAIVLDIYKFQ